MPGSFIGELILQPIAEAVLQLAGYFTGRVVVPVLSLGRASVEPAPKGVRVTPKWHGFQRASDGTIVIEAEMGALLGLLFWVAVAVVAYFALNAK